MKVRIEDFDDDALDRVPNLERIKRKPKEERIPPPKEKSKKPIRYKEIEINDD